MYLKNQTVKLFGFINVIVCVQIIHQSLKGKNSQLNTRSSL